jgi:hypothetical protein
VHLVGGSASLVIDYAVSNLSAREMSVDFGVEFNLALLGGKAPDRYYLGGRGGQNLGNLSTLVDIAATGSFAAVDEWKGIEWWLEFSQAASVWAFPVETASMSEFGIELVYQCSTIIPHWRLRLAPGVPWEASITFAPGER